MNDMHVRKGKDGYWHVVNCPYDSIQLVEGRTLICVARLMEVILHTHQFPCQGDSCVMYPCERVRKFADGEI